MAKSGEIKLNLPSVDDLFKTDAVREDEKRERILDVPLNELDNFPNHPFSVKNDEEMQILVDSIKQYGIHTPALARIKEDGRYELVSGHRRKMACELAGLSSMPVLVREMTVDEATICMVDSNLQREELLYSEKAFSYKMRLEAMNRQGQRTDLTSVPMAQKLEKQTSRQILSDKVGESQDQIRRYIRLTELIAPLLKMVDEKMIAFRPAVELSYLPKEEQGMLLETMECEEATPSLAQAIRLKELSKNGRLSQDVIFAILTEEKPNQKEQFKMPKERISRFFPEGTTIEKIEETIIKALELYRKRQREQER